MVTSCLSLCDLSCCFLFAGLSLCLPAGLEREILHLLVWFISELCLAEGKQVEFLATVVLPRVGKSHLAHAVEHSWDDATDQPQCLSDLVHHPWAGDLAVMPAQWPRYTVAWASGCLETVPLNHESCLEPLLSWCLLPMYWILLTKHRMSCVAGSGSGSLNPVPHQA